MRRAASIVYGAVALFFALSAEATTGRPLIVTTQDHSLVDADDCQHFHTRNVTSLPAAAQSEEQRNLRLDGGSLTIRTVNEGGVTVRGWDRPFASLTVCKSAMALSSGQANTALRQISVAVGDGAVIASGPELNETQTWWVHMILRVPRRATLDVTAANGGIAIRNMSGRVTARATNGGISLASCDGDNNLTTGNGGISLDKIAGRLSATSQNGPISLKLRNTAIPALEAQTDDTGEILCNLKGCADALGNWTPNRKYLRIGSAAPSIRLTSTSADIMIEQVR